MEEQQVQGVTYYLKRKRGMRYMHLRFDKTGRVVVTAPCSISLSKINDFVAKYADKILSLENKIPQHSYQTGDTVLLLGVPRTLEVVVNPLLKKTMAQYATEEEKIIITAKTEDIGLVKEAIKKLYVDTVQEVLSSRVEYWVKQVQAGEMPAFGVNRAKSRWGVCYPKERRLYLSYMCAILPYELMDMVVLHEVCHLKISGHGPSFWALMRANMPDLEQRKAQLREVSKLGLTFNLV